MRLRAEIKQQAKIALKANYGVCLGVSIIVTLIIYASTCLGPAAALVIYPLTLGMLCHFTMVFYGGNPEFSTMFQQGFGVNYGRKLGGYLWMELWIFIWSLLFVIPGIIKSYAYSLTPYILANYPDVPAMEALNISKRITAGNKGKIFIFDLSFIGWALLSALTCGLLAIFYVSPYCQIARAGFFGELIESAARDGVITPHELNPEY